MGSGYLLGWGGERENDKMTKWVKVIDNDTVGCGIMVFYTIMIYFKIICSSEPETGQGSYPSFYSNMMKYTIDKIRMLSKLGNK